MPAAKTTDMIIRVKEDGVEVTYESAGALSRVLGSGQLYNWAKAGAVRSMVRRGTHFYAVLDCAMIRAMTYRERRAAGLKLTPEKYLRYQRAWDAETSRRTEATADHRGEEWDSYDRCFVIDAYNAGAKISEIAKALGRTYSSITNEITYLRRGGDLPPTGRGEEPGWQWRVLGLMTADERAIFLGRQVTTMRKAA